METLNFALGCCGHMHSVRCNRDAIARSEPNERKKNYVCPGCGRLVILTLCCDGLGVCVEDQEIIDFASLRW